jgi:hypothetical protein
MGAKFIASLPDAAASRGAGIPSFQSFAAELLNVTGARVATWLTLLTDAERPAFEAAAVETAARLDPSGALARQAADGIRVAAFTNNITGGVRSYVRAPPAEMYTAAWTNAPRDLPRQSDFFLFNSYAEPLRRAAMRRVIATGLPAITDMTPFTFADPPGKSNPSAVVFAGAWSQQQLDYEPYGNSTTVGDPLPLAGNATAAGSVFCAIAFNWDSVRARAAC